MLYLWIPLTAFAASLLTFYSGFGLGTILTPVFALYFPIDVSIAMTAIVHFLNNLFKLGLTGRKIHRDVLLRFGGPAVIAAFVGAYVLMQLGDLDPLASYELAGSVRLITPVKIVIALVMVGFTLFEIIPGLAKFQAGPQWLPVGGLLSGFFGGLSGHQGALRSAFLVRAGLSKESFIATGVAIACLVDVTRLSAYARHFTSESLQANAGLLLLATGSAFAGAFLGNRALKKLTLAGIQKIVAVGLLILAGLIGSGLI